MSKLGLKEVWVGKIIRHNNKSLIEYYKIKLLQNFNDTKY